MHYVEAKGILSSKNSMNIFNKAGIKYLKSNKSKRFVDVLISGNHDIFK